MFPSEVQKANQYIWKNNKFPDVPVSCSVPWMYPFSLTLCSVGLLCRKRLSLLRIRFCSESAPELLLVAEKTIAEKNMRLNFGRNYQPRKKLLFWRNHHIWIISSSWIYFNMMDSFRKTHIPSSCPLCLSYPRLRLDAPVPERSCKAKS